MSRRPLFSTYRQGENRVTGSMIAVFERLDLGTLQTILAAASEDADLELVRFELQPTATGAQTVPDARISASFDYLFESKIAYDAIGSAHQVLKHLDYFSGRREVDERLFVVTPDPVKPAVIAGIDDSRVVWFSFKALDSALALAVADDSVPEDERFLIRELRALLVEEGLLGRQDVVIVAAGLAYDFYRDTSTYVCQSGRAFRPGLTHLGFYRAKQIKPEIPRILHREDDVLFSRSEADARRLLGSPEQVRIAELIDDSLTQGSHVDGVAHQVFLLSPVGDPETAVLDDPLVHDSAQAWTMGQRYAHLTELHSARSTQDLS